jgi:signal transduction histidine kinase
VRWTFVALLAWSLLSVSPAVAADEPKRIVTFSWLAMEMAPSAIFERTLHRAVRVAPGRHGTHEEYFEDIRFPGEDQSRILHDYPEYAGRRVDVVIAFSQPALDYVLKYRADLFPQASIVYYTVGRPILDDPALARGTTGVVADNAYRKTLDLALTLHPATKEALVIASTPGGSKLNERIFHRQRQGFDKPVKFTYLSDLPLDQLLAGVRHAPEDSIIFYLRHSQDEPDGLLLPRDALSLIERSSNVPIYGSMVSYLGHASVGGYAFDTTAAANRVTDLAIRLAGGARVQDTPVSEIASVPRFDWRQLQRWGIPEDSLPKGSVVLFRELTFWQKYNRYVIVALSLFAAQTALITGLLVQRAKRQRAEQAWRDVEKRYRSADEALHDSYARLQDLAGRLIAAQEAERQRIARDLHDDLSQKLALLSIDVDQLQQSSRNRAPEDVESHLRDISLRIGEIATDIHLLSHQLHPSKLEVLGLSAATESICREVSNQHNVSITFASEDIPRHVDPEVALCVFRIVQEAVHNVVKHSGARAASVRLSRLDGTLDLQITDAGCGFVPNDHERTGLGLVSMRERVHYAGGELAVHSSPGRGTRVAVRIPLRQNAARGAA